MRTIDKSEVAGESFISSHHIRCPKCWYIEDLLLDPIDGHMRLLDCKFVVGWFVEGEHCVDCFHCGYRVTVVACDITVSACIALGVAADSLKGLPPVIRFNFISAPLEPRPSRRVANVP